MTPLRISVVALIVAAGLGRPARAAPTKEDCAKDPTLKGCVSSDDRPEMKPEPDAMREMYCKKYPGSAKCGAPVAPQENAVAPGGNAGDAPLASPPVETPSAEPPPPAGPADEPGATAPVSPTVGPPPESVNGAAEREALDQAGARALSGAGQGSAYFNSQTREAETPPPGGAQRPAASRSARPSPAAAVPGRDPANPRGTPDLLLASVSGFAGAFESMGLKAGRSPSGSGAILRADGTPASEAQVAGLLARVQSEPKALMQRPDFFKVLSRERFNGLKTSYETRPELAETAFKHITMTPGNRDFTRSESCSMLSGACNPYTRQMSYRREEYVSPEELNEISDKLPARGGARAEEEERAPALEAAAAAAADRSREVPRGRLDALFGKLRAMLGALGGNLFDAGSGDGPAGAPADEARAVRAPDGGGGSGRKEAVVFTAASRTAGKAAAVPGADFGGAGAARGALKPRLWAVGAALALGFLFGFLRRKKRQQ
jgi:hypothetical protein